MIQLIQQNEMSRIIGLLLVVLLTMAAALAEQWRGALWGAYTGYRSPYLEAIGTLPTIQPQNPLSNRVIVIQVRGLRADAAASLQSLDVLRDRGADYVMTLDAPLYRPSQVLTLLTGASPEFHGYTSGPRMGQPLTDTLLTRVSAARLQVNVIGDPWWESVLGAGMQFEPNDPGDPLQRDETSIRIAQALINEPGNRTTLIWLELRLLDDVTSLAANAPAEFDKALQLTDQRLAGLLGSLDLNRNTVVLLAERGVLSGSDGQAELLAARVPLLMAGPGVRSGARGATRSVHVAPTLAVLLGVPIPAHAQGSPIFLALNQNATQQDALGLAQTDRLVAVYERWAEASGRPRFASELLQSQGTPVDALRWLRNFETALNVRFEQERADLLASQALPRLPLIGGLLLMMLAVCGAIVSTYRWPVLLPGALMLGLSLARALSEPAAGWSTFQPVSAADAQPETSWLLTTQTASISWAISLLFACLLASRLRKDALDALGFVMHAALLAALALLLPVLQFSWQYGGSFAFALPDGSSFARALLQLSALGGLNASLPMLPLRLPLLLLAAPLAMLLRALRGRSR